FVENFHQLGTDALRNFILLLLKFVLSILKVTLQGLLLALDGLNAFAALVITQLAFSGSKLFLESLDFIVRALQLDLLGLKLLLQRIEIALAFVGAHDCALNVDDADLCRHGHIAGGSCVIGICCSCSGAKPVMTWPGARLAVSSRRMSGF